MQPNLYRDARHYKRQRAVSAKREMHNRARAKNVSPAPNSDVHVQEQNIECPRSSQDREHRNTESSRRPRSCLRADEACVRLRVVVRFIIRRVCTFIANDCGKMQFISGDRNQASRFRREISRRAERQSRDDGASPRVLTRAIKVTEWRRSLWCNTVREIRVGTGAGVAINPPG